MDWDCHLFGESHGTLEILECLLWYVCMMGWCMYHSTHVEVRGNFVESVLFLCELKLRYPCTARALPIKLPCWPLVFQWKAYLPNIINPGRVTGGSEELSASSRGEAEELPGRENNPTCEPHCSLLCRPLRLSAISSGLLGKGAKAAHTHGDHCVNYASLTKTDALHGLSLWFRDCIQSHKSMCVYGNARRSGIVF